MRAPLILSLVLTFGCQAGPAGPAQDAGIADAAPRRARTVSALTVQPQRFVERLALTAKLEAPSDVTLSAQGSGTVKTLAALGATVTKGQVVATLDAAVPKAAIAQTNAAIAQAQAQLSLARENHRRQKPLAHKKIISAMEFQRIEAQLAQAKASLQQARAGRRVATTQLDFTQVIAPFEGVVEQRIVESGEQVNPGQPMLRIVDTRTVEVVAGVPERFATEIRAGLAVEVHFNAYGVKPRQATVTFVGHTIDARNRTFTIKAELPNPDGLLKPQMIATVQLARGHVDQALVVPQTAVLRDERGPNVILAVPDPLGFTAQQVRVTLGPASGNEVVISTGIKAGDRVITMGQQSLSTGDPLDLAQPAGAAAKPAVP